jgi:hypothetical protein
MFLWVLKIRKIEMLVVAINSSVIRYLEAPTVARPCGKIWAHTAGAVTWLTALEA